MDIYFMIFGGVSKRLNANKINFSSMIKSMGRSSKGQTVLWFELKIKRYETLKKDSQRGEKTDTSAKGC